MAWINWDHNFIVGNLIPLIKRKIKTIDWLYALTFPVDELHTDIFGEYYEHTTNVSNWQSNIISFETILNEEFSLTYSVGYTGSIYIDQPEEGIEISYMWNEGESVPPGLTAYMFNQDEIGKPIDYMWNEGELDFDYNFIINAPSSISGNQSKLVSLANQIKIAGTKYNIVYY